MKENQNYCVGKALLIYKTDKNTSIEIYKLVCRQSDIQHFQSVFPKE